MKNTGKVHVGTSGWHYKHWKGPFYPGDLPFRDMLPFYAVYFNNDQAGYAVRDALRLHKMISGE